MPHARVRRLLLCAVLAAAWTHAAAAEKSTVCSITVNSSDEVETFRRYLPADRFRFVELVEHGRPDWLATACRERIRCDILVISGHYDGRNEFFSDRLEGSEFLPVDEMERVACSNACPGLFSQLKEVYLFGCNTLNPEASAAVSSEIGRSLMRTGYSRADAERVARAVSAGHAQSSRDRMRYIFKGAPAIYGFSAKAPVGPTAASMLTRYFQSSGSGGIGSGRANPRLLAQFGATSMALASGLTDADPRAADRQEVCRFSDDRLSAAQKIDFVHRILDRPAPEVRMFLDRIERLLAGLRPADRQAPDLAAALDRIAGDRAARERYLDYARAADAVTRARMIRTAARLGWLAPPEERSELMRMIAELLASESLGAAEVDLVCKLNSDRQLDGELPRLQYAVSPTGRLAAAAIAACLGSTDGRARVLERLPNLAPDEGAIAQVYLRERPIADAGEMRAIVERVARMDDSGAQLRALDALAVSRAFDADSLESLVHLFPLAGSPAVQSAIAGILIRSDYQTIATPETVATLREHRLRAPGGSELVDALIRRLEAELAG